MGFINEKNNYFNLQGDNSNLTNIQVGDELTFTTGGQHSVDDMVFVFKIDLANDEVVLVNLQKDIFFNSVTPTLTRINDTKPETSKFNNVNVDGILKDGDGWVISPTLQEEFCKVGDESWTSSLVSSANPSNKGLAYTTDELGYTTSLKSITNCELETRANDSFLLLTFNTLSISQMESLGFNAVDDSIPTITTGDNTSDSDGEDGLGDIIDNVKENKAIYLIGIGVLVIGLALNKK